MEDCKQLPASTPYTPRPTPRLPSHPPPWFSSRLCWRRNQNLWNVLWPSVQSESSNITLSWNERDRGGERTYLHLQVMLCLYFSSFKMDIIKRFIPKHKALKFFKWFVGRREAVEHSEHPQISVICLLLSPSLFLCKKKKKSGFYHKADTNVR